MSKSTNAALTCHCHLASVPLCATCPFPFSAIPLDLLSLSDVILCEMTSLRALETVPDNETAELLSRPGETDAYKQNRV